MGSVVVLYQFAQFMGTMGSLQWNWQHVFKASDTIEVEKAKMPN